MDGRRAFEVHKARKNGPRSSVGGVELEVISSKFSLQFAAIVDAQTCLGGKVPKTSTDMFN